MNSLSILYNNIFFITIFAIITLYCIWIINKPFKEITNNNNKTFTFIFILFIVIIIGTYPIPWGTMADKELYARSFLYHDIDNYRKDLFFSYYTYFIYYISKNPIIYFIITASIYCIGYFILCKKLCPNNTFLLFLTCCSSFCFWGYGVNTIRAGLAASFILLSISLFQNKKILSLIFCIIGIGTHLSIAITVFALIVAYKWNKPKVYIILWIIAVLCSAINGSFFENLFLKFMPEERNTDYINSGINTFYNSGFRIDFLIFSIVPIIIGYVYLVKSKINDRLYVLFYNAYIIANALWVIVIRANFSDRFAYLSWFLMPFIIMYPLLKVKFLKKQNFAIASILFLHELFTFIMYLR